MAGFDYDVLNDRRTTPHSSRVPANQLRAFGDLCTCAGPAAATWGGESDG